ncbi:YhjD/YihY/BrkB family envelope integrity protein [Kribbella sp. NPDC058693]|uniref:YihY/virulence factor BrkB family protein n=1 Tax=Kribbella jiaozuonensis TaxID=2575441 RepID=A0A4U3LWI0_9ACTN|nr:YhjD/YihY/BrkB family envelope integrity protein [Kribbella jiaozuonensis]TKK80172.1 YihY/virulence factor BrkB family protein [Kribbella jiaozuonensis]
MADHTAGPWFRRLEETFVGRCAASFVELRGIDRAMVIASQALTALVPLVLVVSTLAPADRRDVVAQGFIRRFELKGNAAEAVREVFARPVGASSVGVLSLVILVFSGVSLARRLQRLYQDAWRLGPVAGVRGALTTFAGLAAVVLQIALLALARSALSALPMDWLFSVIASILTGVLLWVCVPWLLLDGRLPWRRLVPSGVLASVGGAAYTAVSTIYMPRMMETNSERYGLFGVTLALVGWLLAVSLLLVVATVVGAEFDRSDGWFARRVRSWLGTDPEPRTGVFLHQG